MVEGIYGTVIFGRARGRIMTPEELQRKYAARYGEHQVHLRKPLLEYGGPGLVEIEMKIKLNSTWCGNPLPLLAEWHAYHDNALAAPLIIGGKPMGPGLSLFVVNELHESHRHWLGGGQLINVELTVQMKEYIPFTEGLFASLGLPTFGIPGFQSL
jgi:phage protein U